MTRLGAWVSGDTVEFCTWAPAHDRVEVHITAPAEQRVTMTRGDDGYHTARADGVGAGTRYRFVLRDRELPDPASRAQPDDVHGDSAVIDPAFAWTDDLWRGVQLDEYVLYELHTGTFTPEGTFDAAIARMPALRGLGVTAVELMPVAEFPGARNWGYDGVFPYAVESSYGGPEGLRRFVDAAHACGLAVALDVVYNHLGPEGNVLGAYGPYFTDAYRTPWGDALNFDGPGSDHVRRFFIENALQWVDEFHVDALRLDAVHAIVDPSAYPFVEELVDAVHGFAGNSNRLVHVIAESAANDARLVLPKERGGIGCDAEWNDDFHHALHALLTGDRHDYYADYGDPHDLAVCIARHSPTAVVSRPIAAAATGAARQVCPAPASSCSDRTTTRSATVRPEIGSWRRQASAARGSPRSRCCARRSSRCCSWARSTARRTRSRTSCRTRMPISSRPCGGGDGGSSRRWPKLSPCPIRKRRPRSTPRRSTGRSAGNTRTRRCSSGTTSCCSCAASGRHSASSTRPRSTTHVFADERVVVVTRAAVDDTVTIVLAFDDVPHDVEVPLRAGVWSTLLDTHRDERALPMTLPGDTHARIKVPAVSALVVGSAR